MKLIVYSFVIIFLQLQVLIRACDVTYESQDVYDTEDTLLGVLTPVGDVEGVAKSSNDYEKYFDIQPDNEVYNLVPTVAFQKFEEEISADYMAFNLQITCKDGSTSIKTVLQKIIDTNNHRPEFLKTEYKITLPMPLTQGLDLTQFSDNIISAKEIDISNTKVTFNIEPSDDFEIIYDKISENKKIYSAKLYTKRLVKLKEPKTFTLTVMDSGEPPLSNEVPVTLEIDVDQESYTPTPTFNKAYYVFDYDIDGPNLSSNDITLTDSDNTEISIEDPNSNYFDTEKNGDNIKITLKGDGLPEEVLENNAFVPLTLLAKYDGQIVAKSAVIIKLPYEKIPTTTSCPTVPSTTEVTCPPPLTTESCECPTTTEITCPTITCPPCEECTTISVTPETCAPCTTNEPCPTVTTSEPCPTCPETTTTEVICVTPTPEPCDCTTSPTIEPTTCAPCEDCTTISITQETCEPCTTNEPCPNVTTCEPCSSISTCEPCSSINTCEPCPNISTCEPCPSTSTYEPCSSISTCEPCPIDPECPTTEVISTSPSSEPCNCTTNPTTPANCPNTTPCDCETNTSSATTCPTCSTECPLNCTTDSSTIPATTCPTCPTECPSCTTDLSTIPATTCPTCPTECPTCPTECTTVPATTCPTECITTPADCPTCPTDCPLTSTQECNCGTTQAPTPGTSLKFDKPLYSYRKTPRFIGFLDIIRATATPLEPITYTIDGDLPAAVSYNKEDGTLKITDYLVTGYYEFRIIATGENTKNQDFTTVAIRITLTTICDKDRFLVTSYFRKNVKENEERTTIIVYGEDEDLDNYDYTIEQQYPAPGPFSLDENKNLILGKVDREDPIFDNMYLPQFRITIQLNKKDVSKRSVKLNETVFKTKEAKEENDEENQCVIMPSKINNLEQTVITIIIDDVNDNNPIFKQGDKLIVGYPEENLVSKIAPAYLTIVEATDKDAGINAAIKYTLDTNKFVIHPTSGFIYPTEESFQENMKFKVTATDMNGDAAKGLKASLEIDVRLLKSEEIIVMMLENVLLDELDTTLTEMSKNGINIKSLSASVVGGKDLKSAQRIVKRDTNDFYLRVIAYAISDTNEIVSNEKIIKLLENTEGLKVDDLENFLKDTETCDNGNEDCDEEVLGYIIAVSILGVLLAAFIIIFVVLYFTKFRKMNNNLLLTTAEPDSFDGVRPPHEVDNHTSTKNTVERNVRRPTGYVFNPPPIEEEEEEDNEKHNELFNNNNNTVTYVDEKNDKIIDDDNEETNKDKKKAVSFFSMVEKIEIEEDDDEKSVNYESEKDEDSKAEHEDDEKTKDEKEVIDNTKNDVDEITEL